MKRIALSVLASFVLAGVAVAAQNQELQQKAAAAKQAAARNQQALKSYSWIEKTELSLKGEVKNTKIESCQYGPDGKVQKTELSEPPPPQENESRGGRRHRVKEKIVAKKTGEMKEELQSAAALAHSYVPPDPQKIQAVIAAGNVTLTPSPGTSTLRFADYEKSGDSLTLVLDSEAKALNHVTVASWLDKPENTVTLDVSFQSMPEGVSYASETLLKIPGSNIEVTITNSNYEKIAP